MLPTSLDGILNTADVKHYVEKNMDRTLVAGISNLGDLNFICKTYLGLTLEKEELRLLGGVLKRYQTKGKVEESDAQIVLNIINKYRKKTPTLPFRREPKE